MIKNYDFFISYSRDIYESIIEPIVAQLESFGFNVWLDKTEVTLGTNIYKNLNDTLNASLNWNGAIVVIDPTYMKKEWCQKESDFFIDNKVYSYPILYNLTKQDLTGKFKYYQNFNLATIKSIQDLSFTIDKILLSFIKQLKPIESQIQINSKLLSSIIRHYYNTNSMTDKVLIGEIICQILTNKVPNLFFNFHNIRNLTNIIHAKVKKLYSQNYCLRYDYIIVDYALQYILEQIILILD